MPGQISNASSAVGTVSLLNGHTQLAGKTILYDFAEAADATTDLRTVTAGKTYYLLAAGLEYRATVGGVASVRLQIDNVNNWLLYMHPNITATYHTEDSNSSTVTYPHPIPIAAGRVIQVRSSAANVNASAWIIGWEQ